MIRAPLDRRLPILWSWSASLVAESLPPLAIAPQIVVVPPVADLPTAHRECLRTAITQERNDTPPLIWWDHWRSPQAIAPECPPLAPTQERIVIAPLAFIAPTLTTPSTPDDLSSLVHRLAQCATAMKKTPTDTTTILLSHWQNTGIQADHQEEIDDEAWRMWPPINSLLPPSSTSEPENWLTFFNQHGMIPQAMLNETFRARYPHFSRFALDHCPQTIIGQARWDNALRRRYRQQRQTIYPGLNPNQAILAHSLFWVAWLKPKTGETNDESAEADHEQPIIWHS